MNTSYRRTSTSIRMGRNITGETKQIQDPGFGGIALLMLVHPFLALAMRASSMLATAHALLTLAVGLSFAFFSKERWKAGYAAAYIVGAEVLWRMTSARIYWEGSKYFVILILGIALLRTKKWQRFSLPIFYFGLLCLSIPLTIVRLGISSAARDAISFNMSGPLALMVCILYFSQMTFSLVELQQLAWWMMLPILGIATLALFSTITAEHIEFTTESNFITSGGFGPNQVSAILGLGGGLALILSLMEKRLFQRLSLLILAMVLLTLGALTFSRGGIYNAAVMLAGALAHYMRNGRGRVTVLMVVLVTGLVGGYMIFPRLNAFTGGMLGQRFTETDTTLRGQLAQADLDVWFNNPVFGVGPGISKSSRMVLLEPVAAHTEYTRTLAEHGMAGLLALVILLVITIRTYLQAPNIESQTWVVALLAWPLVEMSHAAMRVVAISFLFGLAMVNWKIEENTPLQVQKRIGRH